MTAIPRNTIILFLCCLNSYLWYFCIRQKTSKNEAKNSAEKVRLQIRSTSRWNCRPITLLVMERMILRKMVSRIMALKMRWSRNSHLR